MNDNYTDSSLSDIESVTHLGKTFKYYYLILINIR